MIGVKFNPETLVGEQKSFWTDWSKRAEQASKRTVDTWEAWYRSPNRSGKAPTVPNKDQKIWKELRDWLLIHYFHHKCAYCEMRLIKNPGETEHFRPKGKVTYKVDGRKTALKATVEHPDGETIPHPGYFWLTHHWLNLLPSCKGCNGLKGKLTQFPTRSSSYVFLAPLASGEAKQQNEPPLESKTWPGHYYLGPKDLELREDPLLLHPYSDNPRKHMKFLEGGIAVPRKGGDPERVKHSIKVYNLNNDMQRVARQEAQQNAFSNFMGRVTSLVRDCGLSRKEAYEKAYKTLRSLSREAEFSAAARDMVEPIMRVDWSSEAYGIEDDELDPPATTPNLDP